MDSSDKMWSTGEENGKPLQYFFLENAIFAQNVTGNQWRNNFRKNEETEAKQSQHPSVVGNGDGSKVRCCKEQYCIGTRNVRSMNQGKL